MKKISELLQSLAKSGKKGLAWLVDPDKIFDPESFNWVGHSDLDLILVGGSKVNPDDFEQCLTQVKSISDHIPVGIFPSAADQISDQADAIFFLSLISGTNPDYLISKHILAAEKIRTSQLEVLPTGYILVNSGEILSVHRESRTFPLDQADIKRAIHVALAGKYLGMDYIFLDAGSGAQRPISPELITSIKEAVGLPLIVGGGMKDSRSVRSAFEAGADLIVIGNAIEKDPDFLVEVLAYKSMVNLSLNVN